MSDNPLAAAIFLLHYLYHQRLSEDTIVTTHQVFDIIHVLYHEKACIVLIPTDQIYEKEQ